MIRMGNYLNLDTCNLANGVGCRVVIWLSGCCHFCDKCFSPHTWNPKGGQLVDEQVYQEVSNALQESCIDGITLLGGEPLAIYNIETSLRLAKIAKSLGKTVWCYSGFTYEDCKDLEIMEYIDVLIDGRFDFKKFNPNLKWRGSANQRIIDVPATRELSEVDVTGKPIIILHKDNNVVDEYFPDKVEDPCAGMSKEEIRNKYLK